VHRCSPGVCRPRWIARASRGRAAGCDATPIRDCSLSPIRARTPVPRPSRRQAIRASVAQVAGFGAGAIARHRWETAGAALGQVEIVDDHLHDPWMQTSADHFAADHRPRPSGRDQCNSTIAHDCAHGARDRGVPVRRCPGKGVVSLALLVQRPELSTSARNATTASLAARRRPKECHVRQGLPALGWREQFSQMLTLELVAEQPDWVGGLQVALTRPPGVIERRAGQDPWGPAPVSRPRRISDDLGWLRAAMDRPAASGLHELDGTAAVGVWEAREEGSEPGAHLRRLDQRGVLVAAGFLLHDVPDGADRG
jgi:hypothetical protein